VQGPLAAHQEQPRPLIGEAGVGNTAIVGRLAQRNRLSAPYVPEGPAGPPHVPIGAGHGALVAVNEVSAAVFRGPAQAVLKDVTPVRPGGFVLFIDELHLVRRWGKAEGLDGTPPTLPQIRPLPAATAVHRATTPGYEYRETSRDPARKLRFFSPRPSSRAEPFPRTTIASPPPPKGSRLRGSTTRSRSADSPLSRGELASAPYIPTGFLPTRPSFWS